jgi:hypothetical protein
VLTYGETKRVVWTREFEAVACGSARIGLEGYIAVLGDTIIRSCSSNSCRTSGLRTFRGSTVSTDCVGVGTMFCEFQPY